MNIFCWNTFQKNTQPGVIDLGKIGNYVLLNIFDCMEVAFPCQYPQNCHLELFALTNNSTELLGLSNRSGHVQAIWITKDFSPFRFCAYEVNIKWTVCLIPAVADKYHDKNP